ncbi:small serum protein 2-like [Labeo rohita]|uniref:small serum protein 2-like n=1 Tax=Labeo rohita TaxID=84645 RepID=UPI0021E2E52E|nr:small serum protein 2-like [Labeo rohita]
MTAFHQTSICTKPAKMKLLALVLVFCAFVSLSDSACSLTLIKAGEKHCVDRTDHSKHLMGSTWTNSRCDRCTCSPGSMECCNTLGRVTSMSNGCIVKYDYRACTFKVFNPEDSSVKCDYAAVGK